MNKLTLAICFAMLASQASAQITDPDQRMRWFNLQRLAIETQELEACRFHATVEPNEKFQAALNRAAGETAAAIEAYVAKYPTVSKDESVDAYRYRVWRIAIRAGIEKTKALPDKSACAFAYQYQQIAKSVFK